MHKSLLALCVLLPGCDAPSRPPATQVEPARPDLQGVPFDQVLLRVKQEVGLFEAQSAAWHRTVADELKRDAIVPRCGTGDINFTIKSVKVEFATVLARTASGGLRLEVPFAGPVTGSVGPGVTASRATTRTTTLDYTYYVPSPIGALDPAAQAVIAPSAVIAPTLAALRAGLVRATTQLPCMADSPAGADNSFVFAVQIQRDVNPQLGFHLWVVAADAGIDASDARTDTITVTFHPTPTGGARIEHLPTAPDAMP